MAKNTSPLVVAATGATTSAVNGSSISPIVSPYSTSCPGTRRARKIPPAGVSTVTRSDSRYKIAFVKDWDAKTYKKFAFFGGGSLYFYRNFQ